MTSANQVVAINGGPRKKWNTAVLLEEALAGAASQGAATEMIHLYDLNFKGCVSCFSCKRKESYRNGLCAQRDDLSPVLEKVMNSRAAILGSPIYLSDVTGALRSFLERLVFMNLAYDPVEPSILETGPSFGLIYTMNIPESMLEQYNYPVVFEAQVNILKRLKGQVEYLTSCDTYQFDDYAKYHAPMFDAGHKKEVRASQFPKDRERAFQMGARLAGRSTP
jgi:multimeric flavodoxin WrbA